MGWANALRAAGAALARHVPMFRGKTRLMVTCDRMLRALGGSEPIDVNIDGSNFVVNTADLNDFKIMYGVDGRLTDYLATVIGSREVVVWDVGANVGGVTLAVAARCPRARIVAIEASPAVGLRLARNLAANPALARRITALHVALSDRSGQSMFYESAESFNSGVGRLQPAGNTVPVACSVPAWSGDDLIAAGLAPSPDIVKLDIEGFELHALQGMARHLARGACRLIFEHEPYRLESPNNPPSPVAFLREHGFDIRELADGKEGATVGARLPTTHCDLVAVPMRHA